MRKNPRGKKIDVKPLKREWRKGHGLEYKPLRDIRKVPRSRDRFWGEQRILRDYSQDEFEWYGCVINPKMMRPYFVGAPRESYNSGRYIIYVPTTDLTSVEVVGAGYFETDEDDRYGFPARITGYPRIHTPAGVADKGTGLGTALYTGGCVVGSHLVVGNSSRAVRTTLSDSMLENAGCSSGPGASKAAKIWWRGATERGLATETTGTVSAPPDEPELDTVTVEFETEDSLDLDDWYNDTERSRYGTSLYEHFSDSYYESLSYDGVDHPFEKVKDTEPQGYSVGLSKYEVAVTATFTFSVEDEEGNKHEGEIDVTAEEIEIDDDKFSVAVDEALYGQFLDLLTEELGEVDESSLESERSDIEFYPDRVGVTLSGEVEVSGYRAVDDDDVWEEEIRCFFYPIENALKAHLVLDFNELLSEEYGEDLEGKESLKRVLNIDLAEVQDPEVFRFFFGLAEHLGATQSQMRFFKNRTTLRGDLPRDIWERDFLYDPDTGFSPELRKKGYIVNPAEELDFQAIGRELYGDLADLD